MQFTRVQNPASLGLLCTVHISLMSFIPLNSENSDPCPLFSALEQTLCFPFLGSGLQPVTTLNISTKLLQPSTPQTKDHEILFSMVRVLQLFNACHASLQPQTTHAGKFL